MYVAFLMQNFKTGSKAISGMWQGLIFILHYRAPENDFEIRKSDAEEGCEIKVLCLHQINVNRYLKAIAMIWIQRNSEINYF